MHALARRLFPIPRSLTGAGVRETLAVLGEYLQLSLHEVPSGTRVFDWTVPREWRIRDAFIADGSGRRVVDFRVNNLHVVGYSTPVDVMLDRNELEAHLHSLPDQPDAIPYVTSYYQERWGFCLSQAERDRLPAGRYRAVIDSELFDGHLSYAEAILPGERAEEVFLSTYVCHPQMANNELSGPVVATFLGRWIAAAPRRYTYRIVFIPETIGSITYLSRNLDALQRTMIAGFNLTCCGDERAWSYLPSRRGDSIADRAALHVLRHRQPNFIGYSFLDRGSDERQYCSAGANLPVASIMRSKYGAYPEYHTSKDDLTLVTATGLGDTFALYVDVLTLIERNRYWRMRTVGEPQLGKYGLYPTLSTKERRTHEVRTMMNFIAYADGTLDLIGIADAIGVPAWELYPVVDRLEAAGLVEEVAASGS